MQATVAEHEHGRADSMTHRHANNQEEMGLVGKYTLFIIFPETNRLSEHCLVTWQKSFSVTNNRPENRPVSTDGSPLKGTLSSGTSQTD